ncbi:hypothetical protein DFH07DRAFT_816203 [Mycena maculata]|uniref:Indole-diterpene biosynthesis protein PaxU n=1 Tax=Mycena maculata TaxID=230809 RepID=A0AAD7JDW2_9AGAR|nr:hypothetical protein DFH07DRAFT_816203 [Mycena maculata]
MAKSSVGSFTPLGHHAFIQRLASSPSSPSSNDPTVILIFGWMSAKLAHLHKYTTMYNQIYPDAIIILVRSHLSIFWKSGSALDARFKPVIEVLKALGCLENRQRILTHSFSNGGSFHLLELDRILSSRKKIDTDGQTPQTPPSALIIDSSPGGDTLDKLQLAVTSPLKSLVLRFLANLFIRLVFCVWWTRDQLLRRPSPIHKMMRALRRPRVLPWLDARSPRLYVYSKMDEMVPWRDVEEHAAQSAGDGLDVRLVCFEESPHVAHARVYPEEYWAAVRKVWADACAVRN